MAATMYRRIFSVVPSATNNLNFLLSRNQTLVCQPCATVNTRSLEKRLGIPPKPKRPLSAFIKFSIMERENLLQENPNLSALDTMKKLGEKWQTYSIEEKEKLKKICREEMEQYTKEVMKYEQGLTEDQKKLLKGERYKMVLASEKSKMKSRLQELGRPKRPATTFILYMLSKINTKSKDINFPDWLTIMGKEWNALPAEKKGKFKIESKKLMEQYKTDMIRWEEKMIKMGHIDVVRRQVLLDLKGKGVPQLE